MSNEHVGLGMSKGGTEIAAKAISTHLELNPKWAAFKNDFSNAFNACARRRMVEQLLKSPFGHFEPAFRLFYEHAGALFFEGERLPADSCEGAQQGDPLGPFIFALAFHATLQQVAAEYTTQGGGKTPPQTPPPTLSRRSTCRAQMRQTEELISARYRHGMYCTVS